MGAGTPKSWSTASSVAFLTKSFERACLSAGQRGDSADLGRGRGSASRCAASINQLFSQGPSGGELSPAYGDEVFDLRVLRESDTRECYRKGFAGFNRQGAQPCEASQHVAGGRWRNTRLTAASR